MKFIRLTALGGLGETGALNCMLYHTETAAILVDCGVRFVDDHFYPGCSLVVPNFKAIEPYRDKLKALVLTHGHEDHVGGLPYFLKEFPVPVYATAFTRGIVQGKLDEFALHDIEVKDLEYNQSVIIDDIRIDPIFVNHSIMDASALLIESHGQKILHCTDFKIDHSAPENRVIDLERFRRLGDEGLDLLLSDSTNALSPGWTRSESVVRANLIETFTKIKGRAITCLFSSNVFRLQSLIECARITGRKIALTGRSTKQYFKIAFDLGRLETRGVQFYDVEDMAQMPDHEVLLIVTGSQAEARSVLNRMAYDQFRPFKIKKGDTLVMSSKVIPGNESRVYDMLDRIAFLGAEIITASHLPIHASGHAKQDELREIIRLLKPRWFMPIHGEYRHLAEHQKIAIEEGLLPQQVKIILDGETAELSSQGLQTIDHQEFGELLVSENPDFYIAPDAVKRRKKLAWNGLVVVSVVFDQNEKSVLRPIEIKTQGLFGGALEAQIESELKYVLDVGLDNESSLTLEKLQKFFKAEVRGYMRHEYHVRPEVVVMIHLK